MPPPAPIGRPDPSAPPGSRVGSPPSPNEPPELERWSLTLLERDERILVMPAVYPPIFLVNRRDRRSGADVPGWFHRHDGGEARSSSGESRPPTMKEIPMSGETDQVKGRVKQAAGDLTDNDDLKREGKADEFAGKVKDTVDDAKDKVEDVVDDVKNKLS